MNSSDVKNGNNINLSTFYANGNPDLTCIEVDNSVEANANSGVYAQWVRDDTTAYSEDFNM